MLKFELVVKSIIPLFLISVIVVGCREPEMVTTATAVATPTTIPNTTLGLDNIVVLYAVIQNDDLALKAYPDKS